MCNLARVYAPWTVPVPHVSRTLYDPPRVDRSKENMQFGPIRYLCRGRFILILRPSRVCEVVTLRVGSSGYSSTTADRTLS